MKIKKDKKKKGKRKRLKMRETNYNGNYAQHSKRELALFYTNKSENFIQMNNFFDITLKYNYH